MKKTTVAFVYRDSIDLYRRIEDPTTGKVEYKRLPVEAVREDGGPAAVSFAVGIVGLVAAALVAVFTR